VRGGSGRNRARFFSFRSCFLGSEGKRQIGVFFSFPLFSFPEKEQVGERTKNENHNGKRGDKRSFATLFLRSFLVAVEGAKKMFCSVYKHSFFSLVLF
jgi:hypothetical protein